MVETVRQYGRQTLRDLGEEVELQRWHRDWLLALAFVVGAFDHREVEAFDSIQLELDNVWSALDFCGRHPEEAAIGIEICRQLYPYWWSRGPLGDIRRVLDAFCPLTAENCVARGWCLFAMARLAVMQTDSVVPRPWPQTVCASAAMRADKPNDAGVNWARGDSKSRMRQRLRGGGSPHQSQSDGERLRPPAVHRGTYPRRSRLDGEKEPELCGTLSAGDREVMSSGQSRQLD